MNFSELSIIQLRTLTWDKIEWLEIFRNVRDMLSLSKYFIIFFPVKSRTFLTGEHGKPGRTGFTVVGTFHFSYGNSFVEQFFVKPVTVMTIKCYFSSFAVEDIEIAGFVIVETFHSYEIERVAILRLSINNVCLA